MLRFWNRKPADLPVTLSPAEDQNLRRAFGRYSEKRYRDEGAAVIAAHYGIQGCFLCGCQPDAEKPPRLYLVIGEHLRREDKEIGTPHAEDCDFSKHWEEQNKLVRSYCRPKKRSEERQLNLVHDFRDKDDEAALTPYTLRLTTKSDRPTLAKTLCYLLQAAHLYRIFSASQVYGRREQQNSDLMEAAKLFTIAPDRPLSDWLVPRLEDYYDLKHKLEARPAGWNRPYGLFIESFSRIENNVLYPRLAHKQPIPVTGKLTIFGESGKLYRPPYLVIGLMTFPTRDAKEVELYKAYAHPCLAWDRLMPVDSNLERETFDLLLKCRNWLMENHNIAVSIEKPLFDVGPDETENGRGVCKPDFILRGKKNKDGVQPIVVIETMGYDNDDIKYREGKRNMRPLFEHIKGGNPPHPVIEHDRYQIGMAPAAIDLQFQQAVHAAVLSQYP